MVKTKRRRKVCRSVEADLEADLLDRLIGMREKRCRMSQPQIAKPLANAGVEDLPESFGERVSVGAHLAGQVIQRVMGRKIELQIGASCRNQAFKPQPLPAWRNVGDRGFLRGGWR